MAVLGRCVSIIDPRDNLDRTKLGDLVRFAQAHGLSHVTHDMPAILIRQELRQRNLTNTGIRPPPLGALPRPPGVTVYDQTPHDDKTIGVDAVSNLARQWEQQKLQPPPPPLPKPNGRPPRLRERPRSEINVLRDTCKRLGIKMERRDNLATLKKKIEAHGQNTVASL